MQNAHIQSAFRRTLKRLTSIIQWILYDYRFWNHINELPKDLTTIPKFHCVVNSIRFEKKKHGKKRSIWIWWPSAVYERRSTKPENNNLIYFVSFGCYHLHGVIHNVVFVLQRHASGSCSFNKLSMITIHIVLFYVDNMLNV